jgi:hypothetical protein
MWRRAEFRTTCQGMWLMLQVRELAPGRGARRPKRRYLAARVSEARGAAGPRSAAASAGPQS